MSVIVVGGGAAGLGAAYFAARNGATVQVLERTSEAGKKILLSGGTRCNVLPIRVDITSDYFSESHPAAVQEVFRSWDLDSCRSWITDDLGLELMIEEESNKYFPKSNSAKDVRNALVKSCLDLGVKFEYSSSVNRLKEVKDGWECVTTDSQVFSGNRVILAAGGKSYQKVGTDGTGFQILKKLGHTIRDPYPALTPLLGPHPSRAQLAGVSLKNVSVSLGKEQRFGSEYAADRGGLLFTHKGYSGPSILDVSHFVTKVKKDSPQILLNWTSEEREVWEARFLDMNWKGTIANLVQRSGIPLRLARALCQDANIAQDQLLSQLTKSERLKLLDLLSSYKLKLKGHGGYKLAEVTGGGVPFEEINCKTMESLLVSGIFICGELMDIFGRIGGFNFYWAWISGRLCGLHASHFTLQSLTN